MNTRKTLFGTILAALASAALSAAVPNVTGVAMSQANDRLVTITYTLSDAPAVVTVDVQTNAAANAASDDPGWTSIGGEAIWNALGDVWKRVEPGSRTIRFRRLDYDVSAAQQRVLAAGLPEHLARRLAAGR